MAMGLIAGEGLTSEVITLAQTGMGLIETGQKRRIPLGKEFRCGGISRFDDPALMVAHHSGYTVDITGGGEIDTGTTVFTAGAGGAVRTLYVCQTAGGRNPPKALRLQHPISIQKSTIINRKSNDL
jgi:hypothetical protein